MYEPSRTVTSFFIAGMTYWDGCLVVPDLRPGDALELVAEPDNPHDPCAVALCRGGVKLGYVPRDENALASLLLAYGHDAVLEARVLSVDPSEKPWHQVFCALSVTDARRKPGV